MDAGQICGNEQDYRGNWIVTSFGGQTLSNPPGLTPFRPVSADAEPPIHEAMGGHRFESVCPPNGLLD